jgi:hypothetical protein
MADFIKQIRFLFSFVFAFLALFFVLQLVSSTISIFSITYNLNHIFGYVTLSFLILTYFALLAIPLNFILRMPKALVPPASQNSKEFELYIEKLKMRLSTNKYLQSLPLNSRDDIENAYICLDAEANKQIRSAAAVVFFGTGVSQNGKFDAVIVVITQISLIWRIAYIYNQRPSLREVAKLYVNVFSCAFVSSSIDGMVDSAAESTVEAALGVGGSIFSSVYSKVAGSLADGSINALMSVRLGVITRRAFNPFEVKTKAEIRKGASIEALAILTEIAGEKAKTAGVAVGQASMKAAVATAEASKQAASAIGDAVSKTASSVGETSKKAGVATVEASKQAASAIGEAASKTASSVSETSKKAGVATVEASKQAASAIGEAASKTASSVSETSKKAGVATAEASKQAASAIGEAASKTASSVGETSKRVADFVKSAVNKPKS